MHLQYDRSYFHNRKGVPLVHRGFVARVALATLLSATAAYSFIPPLGLIVFVLASSVAGVLGILVLYRREKTIEIFRGPATLPTALIPIGIGFCYLAFAALAFPKARRTAAQGAA